jgi:quercetin dioxygenase-like cupin family protein
MAMQFRRVITGHDASGKAVVKFDGPLDNFRSNRPGGSAATIWTADSSPVNNDGDDDAAERVVKTVLPGGTIFRVVRYEPGVTPRRHRTDSCDYAVVLSGSIDMELDDETVHLSAGDLLVQRGTIHNWVNNGTEDCFIAFVLVDAKPVEIEGKPLSAFG